MRKEGVAVGMRAKTTDFEGRSAGISRGFTLIELLVTLAVTAVLLGLAAPSMMGLIATRRANALTNDLVTSINLARSEAIKRNDRIVLCKSSDGSACSTTGNWEQGWIMFQDVDNNASRDPDESREVVLKRQNPSSTGVTLSGNQNVANYLSMAPSGVPKLISGAFQAGTFTLCTTPVTSESSRRIVLSLSGRARVETGTLSSCS